MDYQFNISYLKKAHRRLLIGTICSLFILVLLISYIKEQDISQNHPYQSMENNVLEKNPVKAIDTNGLKIGDSFKASFHNNYVFILDSNVIDIFDFTNPQAPKKIGYCEGAGFSLVDLVATDDYLFTIKTHGDKNREIHTYDLSNLKKPKLINNYEIAGGEDIGYFEDVALFDNKLFLSFIRYGRDHRLEVYDLKQGVPSLLGKVTFEINQTYSSDEFHTISITENYAFISIAGEKIDVLDISDLTNIKKVCEYSHNIHPYNIEVKNNYVYVADDNYGLMVLSFQNEDYLEKVYQFGYQNASKHLFLQDNIAAVYQKGEILTFNITNLGQPSFLSRAKVPYTSNHMVYAIELFIYDEVLILFESDKDLLFYDISNPLQIELIKNLSRFWGYFSLFLIGLIVPSYCIINSSIKIIKQTNNFSKSRKRPELTKIADNTSISLYNSSEFKDSINSKLEEKKLVNGEQNERSKNRLLDIIWFRPYHFAFILLAIQNLSFLIFIPLAEIIGAVEWPPTKWAFYLANIPLFLDLLAGLVFIIALFYHFREERNFWTVLSVLCWIIWIVFAFSYRYLVGMPDYYRLYASVYDFTAGYNYNFQLFYWAANIFALSLVFFWFALHFTDKAIQQHLRPKKYLPLKIFGTANLIFGIPLAFKVLWDLENFANKKTWFYIIISWLLLFFKIIIVPMMGLAISFINKLQLRCSNLLENDLEKNRKYCEKDREIFLEKILKFLLKNKKNQ